VQLNDQDFLVQLFEAAVAAADPAQAIAPFMPAKPKGKTVVIGAGKGAAQLAQAFERHWHGPLSGTVVTRYGFAVPCTRIQVLEAAHPVPDEAGLAASQVLFDAVQGLGADDLVVALISGGGSALLAAPAPGLSLRDEVTVNKILLASGAPISVMNMIRKHISAIKGGRLAAAAHPAKVVSLVVSDVPGDDPAQVASGPTVPDRTSATDALAAADRYDLKLPDHIRQVIAQSKAPLPDDRAFARDQVHVVASAAQSLASAAQAAERAGIPAVILSDSIEGEARDIGLMHAAIAREVAQKNRPFQKPVLILSGGETTVTIRNPKGRGGRNSEFLLSVALGIAGVSGITALAADTDGIDGSETNAGAFADGGTAQRISDCGVDPGDLLRRNEAWKAFDLVNGLFCPGPTGTNVNDFRAILIR
jgi:hydroxypyruvate reductase